MGLPGHAHAQAVKKSGSGICHCPRGQYYGRTTKFTAFESLEACLAGGGCEPQRGQGTCPIAASDDSVAVPLPDRYDRSEFGGWIDEDGDCQNTRHERLIARSILPVGLSEDGCRATSGRWADPYTGDVHTTVNALEIDHLVPLYYAWERGANRWEPRKQRRFANDPSNLLPVGVAVNRAKGAAGPLQWLPPDQTFVCEYLLRFSKVISRYELTLPVEENAAIQRLTADKCD